MGAGPSTPVALPRLVTSLQQQKRLGGKTVAITGCTSGTGLVLATVCAELGARVVMLNRPSPRADRALAVVQQRAQDAVLVPCDLTSFASAREAAARLRAEFGGSGIDVLCCNAGVMGVPDQATVDGFDVQMQCNHLSHFLLVSEVWPLLETAATQRGQARVVQHSSGARRNATFKRAYYEKNGGHLGGDGWPGTAKWARYSATKLANLLFCYALSDHVAKERPQFAGKILSMCAHPGPAATGLQEKSLDAGATYLFDRILIAIVLRIAQTTEDGACGIVRASCDVDAQDKGFYGPRGRAAVGDAVLLPPERDPQAESKLWEVSLASTGITSFFPS